MVTRTQPHVRRLALLAVVALGAALLLVPKASNADVTSVTGSAFGYQAVGVHGPNPTTDVPSNPGPAPVVTLPTTGSSTPITATLGLTAVRGGPATIFSFASASVSTEGTTGPHGSVTSSATINGINQSGQENLTASSLSSTCTATETDPTTGAVSVSGSTTIMGGSVETDNGDTDPTNSIPDHPAATQTIGTTTLTTSSLEIDGHVHIGDQTDFYRYVFNEQSVSPDGKTITVTAAHLTLGTGPNPIAGGDLYIGRSVCGLTTQAVAPTTIPQTTIPQTTIPTIPQTTVPQTTIPQTTIPQTTIPQTTIPQTTIPQTTIPQTTIPQTTIPQTTVPQTTVPQSTVPQTTVPGGSTTTTVNIPPGGSTTTTVGTPLFPSFITDLICRILLEVRSIPFVRPFIDAVLVRFGCPIP